MNYLIIHGNPKDDGICHSLMEEVIRGAKDGGANVQVLSANDIPRCRMCDDGWGVCYKGHNCVFGDDDGFNEAQSTVKTADAICIISPVYWWEVSESLKAFLDRIRRCENWLGGHVGALNGKSVLLIATAGGSGNGILPCLDQMDRFCKHTEAKAFDYLGVNRWNQDYMRAAAYTAAKAMAEGRKHGDTV